MDDWPKKGRIEFKKVSLRYDSILDPVVEDVSFCVEPRQKVTTI